MAEEYDQTDKPDESMNAGGSFYVDSFGEEIRRQDETLPELGEQAEDDMGFYEAYPESLDEPYQGDESLDFTGTSDPLASPTDEEPKPDDLAA